MSRAFAALSILTLAVLAGCGAPAGDVEAARGFYRQVVEICPDPTGERAELEHARAILDDTSAS